MTDGETGAFTNRTTAKAMSLIYIVVDKVSALSLIFTKRLQPLEGYQSTSAVSFPFSLAEPW